QILIENIEYIHKLIQKINYQKNLKLCDEDIEDIFQNISIKLLDKGIAQFQGKSKFQTYLFTIVRNEVLEYVRIHSKEYSESKFKNDDNDDEDVAEQYRYLFSQHSGITIIDYVDLMVRKDIVHIIDTTLDTFDDKDKLIFTWYFLCKLTQNKIAHMIKLSQPSVAER
ncbi:MAG: sigma-70 family RNA polymerase sigma factor, partial [Spirochaetota bacterium]